MGGSGSVGADSDPVSRLEASITARSITVLVSALAARANLIGEAWLDRCHVC